MTHNPVPELNKFEESVEQALNHIKASCKNVQKESMILGIQRVFESAVKYVLSKEHLHKQLDMDFEAKMSSFNMGTEQMTGFRDLYIATKKFLKSHADFILESQHMPKGQILEDSIIQEISEGGHKIVADKAKLILNVNIERNMIAELEQAFKASTHMIAMSVPAMKKLFNKMK
ncbi:MAG: hypothetical protein IPP74_02290 [Alphaproteobacteria bacterium]|nr:hypothetical protein [Alphaproteobacteria bacterium]